MTTSSTTPASERLCDLIIENKIQKSFVVQARIDMSKKVSQAPGPGAAGGLQGLPDRHRVSDDRILKQLQKGITQQQVRDAFAVLSGYDFYLHGTSSTATSRAGEEMLYIPKFAKEIKVDSSPFQNSA